MTETDAAEVDVEVCLVEPGEVVHHDLPWFPAADLVWRTSDGDGSWLRGRYEIQDDWAEFIIDGDGRNAWFLRSAGFRLGEVKEILLGQMFSSLASQRGLTCLHSSVVRVAGRVIAMIGPSGAGKSSTALALVKWSGAELVADDVAVLSDRDGQVCVAAGASRLRMREAPALELSVEYQSLDRVWHEDRPMEPKRYLQIDRDVTRGGVDVSPLEALYFLELWSDELTEPGMRDLSPVVALPRLMAERHMLATISKQSDRRDFDRLARLLRQSPARELLRPAGLDTMPQVVETIAADVKRLGR